MTRYNKYFLVLLSVLMLIPIAGLPEDAGASVIKGASVKAGIIEYVHEHMSYAPEDVRITFPQAVIDRKIPGDKGSFQIQNRPNEDFIGDSVLRIKYFSGERLMGDTSQRIRVEVLRNIVTAARLLTKGEPITESDLKIVKEWVRRIPVNTLQSIDDAVGKCPIMNIRENRQITKNILKAPLLVRRGELVRIVLEEGSLNITTMGVSQENGKADETVRIKNLSSNRIIYARVAGDSLVRVDF